MSANVIFFKHLKGLSVGIEKKRILYATKKLEGEYNLLENPVFICILQT